MAPRHLQYDALPLPAVMQDQPLNRWSSRSGVFLMGGGLACLLGMALVAKTYVLDSTATHRSANRVTQLYGVPPMSYVSGTNDCTGDPAYWRPEIHNFCCEVYGTGPGCRSMSRNAADASSYDPGSLDYDVGRFSDPDYLSGSVDPDYEYETSEVSRADKAAGLVHPDGKEFDDDQDFYDCTSIKEEDSLEKLTICCHHGNAGCKQLALKKAAKKEQKEKKKEEKEKGYEVQPQAKKEKKEEKKEVKAKEKVMEDNKKDSSSTTSESEDRTTGSTTSASTAATNAATASTTTTTTTTTSTESTSTTTNEIDWMYELAKEDKVNISMPLPKPGTLRDLDDLIARLHPNSTTLKPWTIPGVHYGPIPHMQFMQ